MKILHVITGLRKAAGTSVFVCEIAKQQVKLGHEVSIVHQETWRTDIYPLDNRISLISKKDFFKTEKERHYDIVHIHGMWEYMLHQFAVLCRHRNWPYIWSPHGSMTPWAMNYKRWKKLPVWMLWQRHDIAKAAMLHVTAPYEEQCVRKYGFHQPCVIAPLGVDVAESRFSRGGVSI